MYGVPRLRQADPFGALTHELERQTDPTGLLGTPLAGQALRDDNENFAFALFEIMPPEESARIMSQLRVPVVSDQRLMRLMAAMLLALPANYMNISLRQEMTRVMLAKELYEQTAKIHGLGSWFSEAVDAVEKAYKTTVRGVSDLMQRLGRGIGKGLRQFGDNIHNFRMAMITMGGPAMRYVTDFLILTPGVAFVFGDLLREVGGAMEEFRRVNLLPIASGYARYLEDMSLVLQQVGTFGPPPWNLIAKVMAVVYKAGAMLINWQITEHIQDLMARQAEANAAARAAMESALIQMFRDMAPELAEAGALEPSEHGANTPSRPAGGSRMGGMLMVGIFGAAAVVVLMMGRK